MPASIIRYLVRWEIEIDADSPKEAALKACDGQTRPNTTAVVFDVFVTIHSDDPVDGTMRIAKVDLAYPEESKDFTFIDLLTPRMNAPLDAVEINTARKGERTK